MKIKIYSLDECIQLIERVEKELKKDCKQVELDVFDNNMDSPSNKKPYPYYIEITRKNLDNFDSYERICTFIRKNRKEDYELV